MKLPLIFCFVLLSLQSIYAQLSIEDLNTNKTIAQIQLDFSTHVTKSVLLLNSPFIQSQIGMKASTNYLGERAWFCKFEDELAKYNKAICSFRIGSLQACNDIEYSNR